MITNNSHMSAYYTGALKSRDLTTRDHIARVDIARLDNAAPDQTVVSEH